MAKRPAPPPPNRDNNNFRDDLKRQFITELVKSPIAIVVAVVTTLIVGFITFRPGDTAQSPTPPPTTVAAVSSSVLATSTSQPPANPTTLPTLAPTLTTEPPNKPTTSPSPTQAQSIAQTANPDDYLLIEQSSECPSLRLLPDTLSPENGVLNSRAVFDAFFDLIKAPEVPKPTAPLQAILTFHGKPENQNWLRLDHTVRATIRSTSDIPDHSNIVRLGGCGGGAEARDFEPIKLDATYTTYQAESTFTDVDFFTLEPGEIEEFNIQFVCATPGRYQIEINIPFRHLTEAGSTSNSLTVLCPKSYTVWDSEDMTGVTSTSYTWDGSAYRQTE